MKRKDNVKESLTLASITIFVIAMLLFMAFSFAYKIDKNKERQKAIFNNYLNNTKSTISSNETNFSYDYTMKLYDNNDYKMDFYYPNYSEVAYIQIYPNTESKFIYLECKNSTLKLTNTTLECVK